MYTICPGGGGYSRFQVTLMIEGRKVVKFGKFFFFFLGGGGGVI